MKKSIVTLLLLFSIAITAQVKQKTQIVEVSCGQCQFGMKAKGCDLAVRIDDKSYFVDGTKLDDHGDAHGKDGFCTTVRKAKVIGEIVIDRFVVTEFKLLPIEFKKK